MPNNEIQSNIRSLNDLFLDNSSVFYIPDFQRSFVWNEKDVEKLLNDFDEDTEHYTFNSVDRLQGYLLGNIVLIDDGDDEKKKVIDGQQRLTTISLIFKALHSVLSDRILKNQNNNQVNNKLISACSDLNKGFRISDDDDNFQCLKIQHDAALSFGKIYKKIINDEDDGGIQISTQADQNINDVYDYICNYLESLTDSELIKFSNYFKKKVKLIETIAPTMAKAFQLFEVLNDRGRSLEPMDLIKNHFLKILSTEGHSDQELKNFNDNWKAFTDNLFINNKKQISSSTFIRHYLMAFEGENIKQESLFNYFKDDKNNEYNGAKILEFATKIKNTSHIYASIEKDDYFPFSNNRNMSTIFKILKVKQIQPLLMPFYDADNSKKDLLLDTLSRFAAAVIFSYTQTNYIESTTTSLMKDYNMDKDKDKAFVDLINKIEKLTSELSKTAKSILETKTFTSKSGGVQSKLADLLKFIEFYFNDNNEVVSPANNKKITVEHILSRNITISDFSKFGFADTNEKKEYENRLGNLTLMYNSDNSSLGNSSFKDKIPAYKNCSFKMTHTIVEQLNTTVQNGMDTALYNKINKYEKIYSSDSGEWDKVLIEKRSADLADLFRLIVTKEAI